MSRSNFNRRNFLKAGVLGATGAMMTKVGLAEDNVQTGNGLISPEKNEAKIITRTLGRTGMVLPIVSMGVMRADNPNLVKAALAKGIVHLDTAHGYQEGRNETMLGELLKDYPRESFVISTKIHLPGMNKSGEFTKEADPEEFMEMFNTSLERLGLEYVDILYLHAISTRQAAMFEPVLKVMSKIKKSGRARFLGVSTHSNMPEVLNAVVDAGIYDVVLTSYNYQMKDMEGMEDALTRATDSGIGIVAMKTMAGGFKDKARKIKVNTKAALKWALNNEKIHTSIPGYTSFDQLDESFSVMENLHLSEEEKRELFEEPVAESLFCLGCKSCSDTCRKKLPVQDLMRAYMYTYGYQDHKKAQEVLFAHDEVINTVCTDCDSCTVVCVKGFDVASRITDVARLKEVPREFFA